MIESRFLSSLSKKIDKLDKDTLKKYIYTLIQENESLKTVFNSMKEGVLVVDIENKIIFYNKIILKLLQLSNKDYFGFPLKEMIGHQTLMDIIQKTIDNEDKIIDAEIYLDLNMPKYIALSIHPLVQNGMIIGNIILIDDVTQEKENKNKLRQVESLAALTTISAGIAHEIKNPLGAISIHVQLLEQELRKKKSDFTDEVKFSFNVVQEEIERLNKIVIDYLMTVRPLKPDLVLTNLNDFLDNFVNFVSPELELNHINLEKRYESLPQVWLDEKYFKQALLNLINNSMSAIQKDGKIVIEAFKKQNYVFINIIDNGSGISEELKPKIFNPYFTTKSNGTGLGLTIVYKIIKEHRGEIDYKSKPGETCFTIKLPLSIIEEGLIEYTGAEQ